MSKFSLALALWMAFVGMTLSACGSGTSTSGDSDNKRDACASESCSDHGVCALVSGTTRCLCDEGYLAQGMACVSDGSGGNWPPDQAHWLGLTVPFIDAVSPDGSNVIYASMTPDPEEPMQFVLGSISLRNVATATDVVLVATPVFVCGFGGCAPSDGFEWMQKPGWLFHRAYDGTTFSYEWFDSTSNTRGGFTLQQFERIVTALPDASGAISIKQTYMAQGGAVRFHPIPSGSPVTLTATTSDPGNSDIAVTTLAGQSYAAVHLGISLTDSPQALTIYSVPSATAAPVGEIRSSHLAFVGERLVFNDLDANAVKSVPLAGTPIATLGEGDFLAGSPQGTYVLLKGTDLRVVRTDASGEAVVVPIAGTSITAQWENDTTLVVLSQKELYRWQVGAASATLLDDNVSRFLMLSDGMVVVAGSLPGNATAFVTDGSVGANLNLTSALPAYVLRGSQKTAVGSATTWQAAAGTVLANRLYFDVLNGFAAGATNGTELIMP